jgi:hypothetical protein
MSFFELVGQGLVAYILVRLGIYLSKAQLSILLHISIHLHSPPPLSLQAEAVLWSPKYFFRLRGDANPNCGSGYG